MSEDTFGGSIRARAQALGIKDEGGHCTPARLAAYLNARWKLPPEKQLKERTVASWFANQRVPRTGRMARLLRELRVHGGEVERLLGLAAKIEPDDGPPLEDEAALDGEGRVPVPGDVAAAVGLVTDGETLSSIT